MRELAENGGCVCAVYDPFPGCKIGFVEPESEIKLFRGKWGHKNERYGQEAILKSLELSRAKELGKTDSLVLLAACPRQGTFCRWPKAGRGGAVACGSIASLYQNWPGGVATISH